MANDISLVGEVGVQVLADGAKDTPRLGRTKEWICSDAHARYQEAVYRGSLGQTPGVFSISTAAAGVTVVAANVSPLGVGGTPIVGIYNPISSNKIAVIWKAIVGSLSGTPGAGGLVLNVIPAAAGITAAGVQAISNATFNTAGSSMRSFINTAITGSVLAQMFRPLSLSLAGTVLVEELAGDTLIYPGCFLGIAAAAAGVTWVVSAALVWEEISL